LKACGAAKGQEAVGAKWVFNNKLDKQGNVVRRNKVKLMTKGYS